MTARRWALGALTVLYLGVSGAGCASPVDAVRVDQKVVYHDLGRSAVSTGEPSWPTLVVRSNHSTQANPHTIEEVRRILRLQAGVK